MLQKISLLITLAFMAQTGIAAINFGSVPECSSLTALEALSAGVVYLTPDAPISFGGQLCPMSIPNFMINLLFLLLLKNLKLMS